METLDDYQPPEIEELELREGTFVMAEYLIFIVGAILVLFWTTLIDRAIRIELSLESISIMILGLILSISPAVFTFLWRRDTIRVTAGELHPEELLRAVLVRIFGVAFLSLVLVSIALVVGMFTAVKALFDANIDALMACLIALIIIGIHWFYMTLVYGKYKEINKIYLQDKR